MNKKTIFSGMLILILLFIPLFVLGDAGGGPLSAPDAPAASNLPEYKGGDTNLYTGDFSQSLALMVIPGRGGLDYPLSLSYSAGITLEQESSWVGLGWGLSPDHITQSVISYAFGEPDIFQDPPEYNYNLYAAFGNELGKIKGDEDAAYMERDGVGIDVTLELESTEPVQEIVTRDGTRYLFEEYETIDGSHSAYWYCDPDGTNCELKGPYSIAGEYLDSKTKYVITKILSPDYYDENGNGDVDDEDFGSWIKFEYATETYSYEIPAHMYNSDCGIYAHPDPPYNEFYACLSGPDTEPQQFTFDHIRADGKYVYSHRWIDSYNKKYLKSIETPSYKAVFSMSERAASDFLDKNGKRHKRLNSIKLYDKEDLEQEPQGSSLLLEDISGVVETYSGGSAVSFDLVLRGYDEFLYGVLSGYQQTKPVWMDRFVSDEPKKLKLHFDAHQQGENIYLNEGTITITYTDDYPNNYRDLTIHLPEVNGEKGDEFYLYVGQDGATYWNSAMTEYAAGPDSATPLQEIRFVYDYSLMSNTDSGKLTLKEVITKGSEGGELPGYKFRYYNDMINPEQFNYDWWGYYNPRTGLFDTIDQSQSIPWMWSLQEITLPTGGKTSIEYEQDTFRDIQNAETFITDQYGGGERVKKIETYDGINPTPITTNYYYDTTGDGTGASTGVAVSVPYAAETQSYIESEYIKKYAGYAKVTTKLNNGEYGKIETNFITSKDEPDESVDVSVWQPDNCDWDRLWCNGYKYSDLPCGECPDQYYYSNDFLRGYITSKKSYDAEGQVVQETQNTYNQKISGNHFHNTGRAWTQLISQDNTIDGITKTTKYGYAGLGDYEEFENGLVHSTTEYDNQGNKRVTWNLYAAAGWPNPTHDALENKNMLSQSAGTVISNTDEISAFIDNLYYAEFIRYKNYGLWGQQSYYPELTCSWLDSDDNNFWYTNPCEGEPIYETGEWLVMNLTSYDIYGNLLEVKDYEGNPSWIRYDELGIHPVKGWSSEIGSESNPAWQAGYDTAGNIINMTDANGQTTYYAYDEFNRLENVQLSGESEPTTSHEYYLAADSFSLENPNYVRSYQKLEDGKIFTTTTYLDGLSKNLQTGITESPSSEIKTNILYNAAGFVSAKSKPYKDEGSRAASYAPLRDGVLTSEITYKPNPLKRMDKAYPISSEPDVYVQAFYEAKDLELNDCSSQEDCYTTLISVDEEGKQTIKQLDKLGNTVQVIDASNNKSIYEYDFLSNLKNVTNANSLVTLYEYDRLGRITNSTNPNTGTTKLTYDGNGNIKTRNDSEGNLVTFSYDGLGRPTRSDYPDSSYIEYVYDEPRDYGIGRLTKVTSTLNGFLTIKTYHYDEKGRIVKTITTLNGEDHVIEYEYDLAGNLVYEKLSDGTEIEYIYNNMNQLQNIKVNGVEKISYVYDALNNPLLVQNIDYPNSQTVFTYDDRDRVDTLSIEGAED
ncbi:MAG: hypothetical protein ABIE94_04600, partial [archaeon]